MRRLATSLLLVAVAFQARATGTEAHRLDFGDATRDVYFLALDLESGARWWAVSEGRDDESLDRRWPPFSTFKIPNLLIALDTGTAASLEHTIDWNPASRPVGDHWPADWAQAQTLRSAFRRSAVWYFRDLALEIGGLTYRDRLRAFGYGNAAAPDDSDLFWLDGTLRISVREQVDFLASLLRGALPVSEAARSALSEAARLDARGGHVLFGKTGAGPAEGGHMNGAFRGWLVGWVERSGGGPVVFALFVEGPSWASIARFRREAAERLLIESGVWPAAQDLDAQMR